MDTEESEKEANEDKKQDSTENPADSVTKPDLITDDKTQIVETN